MEHFQKEKIEEEGVIFFAASVHSISKLAYMHCIAHWSDQNTIFS